jgi:hypothetical protein
MLSQSHLRPLRMDTQICDRFYFIACTRLAEVWKGIAAYCRHFHWVFAGTSFWRISWFIQVCVCLRSAGLLDTEFITNSLCGPVRYTARDRCHSSSDVTGKIRQITDRLALCR